MNIERETERDIINMNEWCVYYSDWNERYYVAQDRGDFTLADVCFRGTEEECEKKCDELTRKLFEAIYED